jgi:hypothetical protein
MLKLDAAAFGGLGSHTEFPGPHAVQSVDLETGDAMMVVPGTKRSAVLPREVAYGQDELHAIVRAGVAACRAARKDWKLEDHPELAAWLGQEAAPPAKESRKAKS